MKKRAFCAALCLSLCLMLTGQAFAAEDGVTVTFHDVELSPETSYVLDGGYVYASYLPIVKALYPDATAVWEHNYALVTATGLNMKIRPSAKYLEVNRRYLPLPDYPHSLNGSILVPVGSLSRALGAPMQWIPEADTVRIAGPATPIESGDTYYEGEDFYWLSHIINAESGNQPLEGKIAVGNVVLNRVEDPRFPSTVHDVIFQRNQFTPVKNGSINKTPNEESLLAAKLCLEGYNAVGDSLYFVNPRVAPGSWASRHRPHVATIGAHAFYA